MVIHYSVSDIIQAVNDINSIDGVSKKIDKSEFKTSNLNIMEEPKEILEMEEKEEEILELKEQDILPETEKIISEAESTITQESNETLEEKNEETLESSTMQPFQIDEIRKVENTTDVLLLTDELPDMNSLQESDLKNSDAQEIKKLEEQVSILRQHNVLLEGDINKISKKINQKENEAELQIKLELIYKQQKVIIGYENQIKELKEQNNLLLQKIELPSDIQEEEIKTKSKIVLEQQSILKDYQDKINNYQNKIIEIENKNLSLKKDNEAMNSKMLSEEQARKESANLEIEEINEKIKHYQEDNLRLSNEVVMLNSKLENTKSQLKQFEDNKSKLATQLEGLNNIISENNIIGTSFSTKQTKNLDQNETIPNENLQKKVPNIIKQESENYPKNMDSLAEEIFKKKQ